MENIMSKEMPAEGQNSPSERERVSGTYDELGGKLRLVAEKKTSEITQAELAELAQLCNSFSEEQWKILGDERAHRVTIVLNRANNLGAVAARPESGGFLPGQYEASLELLKHAAEEWDK